MFKKFDSEEAISGSNQVKSSVQRGITAGLIEKYPGIKPYIEEILPKKESVTLVKCADRIELLALNKEPLFFHQRDGPWMPTLKLLHKYPDILPHQKVDKGAIRFIMSGANIMAPGLTSKGGELKPGKAGDIVAIMCEGKENAIAIGEMKLDSEEIASKNKGIAIDLIHFLNDGLWLTKSV
eukprot:Clim_evm92s109 gene=Clim_evmTU92s109